MQIEARSIQHPLPTFFLPRAQVAEILEVHWNSNPKLVLCSAERVMAPSPVAYPNIFPTKSYFQISPNLRFAKSSVLVIIRVAMPLTMLMVMIVIKKIVPDYRNDKYNNGSKLTLHF